MKKLKVTIELTATPIALGILRAFSPAIVQKLLQERAPAGVTVDRVTIDQEEA